MTTGSARQSRALLLSLFALLVLTAPTTGCSKKAPAEKPSLLTKIPSEQAMVLYKDQDKAARREISGASLRNFCISQELNLMRSGLPMDIDEWSIIRAGRDLLTKTMLLAIEAERRGVKVADEEVQDSLSKEMARFESTEKWRETLEKAGLSVEQRKQEIRDKLLSDKLKNDLILPEAQRTQATEAMARAFYDKYPDRFAVPHTLHVLHIMRAVAKDAPADERKREREAIDKALARVKGGEKFEDVAREMSTDVSANKGGDIGTITDQFPLPKEIKERVFALKTGDLTDVIESPLGYHVFKAAESKPARQRTFDESKAEIEKQLAETAGGMAFNQLANELMQQAKDSGDLKYFDLRLVLGEPPPPAAAPAASAPAAGAAPAGGSLPGSPDAAPAGAPPAKKP